MRRSIDTCCALAAAGLFLAGLSACQTAPDARRNARDAQYLPITGRPRSVVFSSPKMRRRLAQADAGRVGLLPWYTDRNDHQPAVYWGVQSATVEHTSTFTYERLQQHGPNVRDHLSIRTYRSNYSRSIR